MTTRRIIENLAIAFVIIASVCVLHGLMCAPLYSHVANSNDKKDGYYSVKWSIGRASVRFTK